MKPIEGPLTGKRILIARAADRASDLAGSLRRLGARVDARPTFVLEAVRDSEAIREALAGTAEIDWLVFTSTNGVRFFFDRLREAPGASDRFRGSVAVVGESTAGAVERRGWPAVVVAREARAEGLARELAGRVRPGQRVLIVRPERAAATLGDALRDAGARVEAVAFYRNVPAEGAAEVARDVEAGSYDLAVFASPSGLERLLEAASGSRDGCLAALARMRIVAIGPVTGAALADVGLRADAVSSEPSHDALRDAILRVFIGGE